MRKKCNILPDESKHLMFFRQRSPEQTEQSDNIDLSVYFLHKCERFCVYAWVWSMAILYNQVVSVGMGDASIFA